MISGNSEFKQKFMKTRNVLAFFDKRFPHEGEKSAQAWSKYWFYSE